MDIENGLGNDQEERETMGNRNARRRAEEVIT
jgi:hypothetical protein